MACRAIVCVYEGARTARHPAKKSPITPGEKRQCHDAPSNLLAGPAVLRDGAVCAGRRSANEQACAKASRGLLSLSDTAQPEAIVRNT